MSGLVGRGFAGSGGAFSGAMCGLGGGGFPPEYFRAGRWPLAVFDFNRGFYTRPLTFSRPSSKSIAGPTGLVQTIPMDQLPYDYSWGERALRMEGQGVNLWDEGEDVSKWALFDIDLTENYGTAPDGSMTAALIAKTGDDGTTPSMAQGGYSAGDLTYSAYVKNVSSGWVRMRLGDGAGTGNIWINLDSATVGTANIRGGAIPLGNGWYRVWASRAIDGVTGVSCAVSPVVGDGSSVGFGSMLIWGGQVEYGLYPTTYIPTSGSMATRAADNCRLDDLSGLEGGYTVLVEGRLNGVGVSPYPDIVSLLHETTNHKAVLEYAVGTGQFQLFYLDADYRGVIQKDYTLGNPFQLALRVGPDGVQGAINGVVGVSQAPETYTPPKSLFFAANKVLGDDKPAQLDLYKVLIYPPMPLEDLTDV